jgi:HEAT repeat protein
VNNLGKPCPLAIIEALLDKDEQVRMMADVSASLFKSAAPGSVEVLLRCTKSDDPNVHSGAVLLLGRVAGNDKRAIEAIDAARRHRAFQVRHTAYCAKFLANDKVDEFLAFMIRVRADAEGIPSPYEKDSEEWTRERTSKNLFQLGSAVRIIEWSDQRPEELASALLKLLEDPSPALRSGAASSIWAASRKVDPPKADELLGDGLHSKLLPFLDPEAVDKPDPKKPKADERPQVSKVGVRLEKSKVKERLKKLSEEDPDDGVRSAARVALERLAKLQDKR